LVTANVHTVASSESGTFDEVFNSSLVVTLEPGHIRWPEETSEDLSGSIIELRSETNSGRITAIVGSVAIFGMALAVLLFAIWSYIQTKRIQVPTLETEAIRAKIAHKGIIVDVMNLPPDRTGQIVIPMDYLDELVKVADALLKPVLHKSEIEKHTYQVIDGLTVYQYTSDYLSLSQKGDLNQQAEEKIIRDVKRREITKDDSDKPQA